MLHDHSEQWSVFTRMLKGVVNFPVAELRVCRRQASLMRSPLRATPPGWVLPAGGKRRDHCPLRLCSAASLLLSSGGPGHMQMATLSGGTAPPALLSSVAEAGWDSVGGHADVVRQLKEMVMLPLMYPELLKQMHITAPR